VELEEDILQAGAALIPSLLGNLPFLPPSPSMASLFASTASASATTRIPTSVSIGSLNALAALTGFTAQSAAADPLNSTATSLFADTVAAISTPLQIVSSTASVLQSI